MNDGDRCQSPVQQRPGPFGPDVGFPCGNPLPCYDHKEDKTVECLKNAIAALQALKNEGIEKYRDLGDYCGPWTSDSLQEAFNLMNSVLEEEKNHE